VHGSSAVSRRIRVFTLVLLLLIGVVNYMDRSTLSIANQDISHDLGLGPVQIGLLLAVFSWSYAFAQLPAGPLLDRFGPRVVLGTGLLLWSAAQLVSGGVRSLQQFVGARLFLGIGEAPAFPANAKVVSAWFTQESRGLAVSIGNAASTVGPAIAPPVLTWLLLAFGWRAMFVATGVIGVVLALIWLALYRNPEVVAEVEAGRPAAPERAPWSFREWLWLLRHRTTWGMIFGWMGVIYSIYLYLTWLPAYLETSRHLSIAATGVALILPYVAGTVGQLLGGISGDMLMRTGMSTAAARKWPVCAGLVIGGLFTVPAALTSSTVLALACICGAQLFINVSSSGGWAMAASLADERMTASLGSLQNFGGYFGGAFAPLITGFIVAGTGSFVLALLLSSAVAVVAAVVYAVLVVRPIPAMPAVQAAAVV
jgi:MFS family permease